MTPLLKLFFVLSYVLLAAFVGAFSDSLPKGQVMLIANTVKIIERNRAVRRAASGMNSLLHDNVAGMRQIKAYAMEREEHSRFNASSAAARPAARSTIGGSG